MKERTKVKICGLSRPEDIDVINEVLPDYAGFVFWEKSKRNVSYEQAKNLRARMDDRVKTVGVFVDADMDFVEKLVADGIIHLVQLHGREDANYIRELRKRVDCPIIQALIVDQLGTLSEADASEADYILLDAGLGSGKTFDWRRLNEVKRPFFLAGGLSIENVEEALTQVAPFAIDLSSGLETDGKKDAAKIRTFMELYQQYCKEG